jgi:hypothetical protein
MGDDRGASALRRAGVTVAAGNSAADNAKSGNVAAIFR